LAIAGDTPNVPGFADALRTVGSGLLARCNALARQKLGHVADTWNFVVGKGWVAELSVGEHHLLAQREAQLHNRGAGQLSGSSNPSASPSEDGSTSSNAVIIAYPKPDSWLRELWGSFSLRDARHNKIRPEFDRSRATSKTVRRSKVDILVPVAGHNSRPPNAL
jgi:hypothetical protein